MLDLGKRLSSASFFVFCTVNELQNWIQMLCVEKELGCVTFSGTSSHGLTATSLDEIVLLNDTYAAFLYPRSEPPVRTPHMNDVQSRALGWIHIRPGGLYEQDSTRVLLLSEIHGEDFEHEPVHPAKYVRWLKGRLRDSRTCGVIGKSTTVTGQSMFRNICYTPDAYKLHLNKVVWKQFLDGRVYFEPAKADNRPG